MVDVAGMVGATGPGRLVRGERVLFVSDVHLSPSDPGVCVRFCRFLRDEAAGAAALYVLGDLFDFWVGPRQIRVPGFAEVFARFRTLGESGTEIYFQGGNRDFLLSGDFARSRGFRCLPDVAETTLGRMRVVLTHGDLLCTRDLAYHRMRRVIRSAPARRLIRRLPLGIALRLARGLRTTSGAEIRRKPDRVLDPDFGEIRSWLERGYDALVFGHVHRGERYRVALGERHAEVFILGSWERDPGFVEWDGTALRLRRYEEAGGTSGRPGPGPSSPSPEKPTSSSSM